jgi:hypothetical protein
VIFGATKSSRQARRVVSQFEIQSNLLHGEIKMSGSASGAKLPRFAATVSSYQMSFPARLSSTKTCVFTLEPSM